MNRHFTEAGPPREDRIRFYWETLRAWLPRRDARILVVGAEQNDADVFRGLGFQDVTLLNLGQAVADLPDGWRFVVGNGHALPFDDDAFDFVVTHATLHHCRAPHRALLEMYRVAREGVVFIEARDSLLMRCMERFGMTQSFEVTAVHYNHGRKGGVDDTSIPNYVYRWTEREVQKTIASYAPHARHEYAFRYGTALPQTPDVLRGGGLRRSVLSALRLVGIPVLKLFRRQQNLFAAFVRKRGGGTTLQPWIAVGPDGKPDFNAAWAEKRFMAAPRHDG